MTFVDVASSRPQSAFVAGRLRAAYQVDMRSWYLRPYVDIDVNHVELFGYRERGAGILDLNVFGHSNTSVMVTPSLEIGGRTNLDDATLRSYVTLGASFLSGGAVTTQMKLDEFNLAPFAVTTGAPTTYGNFSAGLEWINRNRFELRGEYSLRAGDHYLDQSAMLRAAYRF
jgi:outer membrane autotransporter protein